jgi:hypothetical protein
MSGRRESLRSVLQATGVARGPIRIDPKQRYEFVVEGTAWSAWVSASRSAHYYESATATNLNPDVALEIDWLSRATGVVFVVDSQLARAVANEEAFEKLENDLASRGVLISEIPIVFQINKRDLPNLIPIDEVRRTLRSSRAAYLESIASRGVGTVEALKVLAQL